MDYIIRTQFREKVTSLTLNEKIDILVGSNRVLDGFVVTFEKGNLNLSNGKCVINGTCIKSVFKKNKFIQIPSNFTLHSELWLSLQYNYEKNTIKEIISETEPVQNYLITLCKLKKNGEGYIIIPLNRALDLSAVSDIANETYKSQKELQKAYDDQIKNITQSNPSNMEVVDARGGFSKLKDKLKNIEDTALEEIDSVRANINENANRIDELSNHTPVWRDYTSNGAITAHDTFYGIAKNLTVEGRTFKNECITKEVNIDSNTIKNLNIPNLRTNKQYTIFFISNKTDAGIYLQEAKEDIWKRNIKVGVTKGINIVSFIVNEDVNRIRLSGGSSVNETVEVKDIVLLDGDFSDKQFLFNSYFDSITSSGELENNKIRIKSIGKNLFDKNSNEVSLGIGYNNEKTLGTSSNVDWAITGFVPVKPNTTYCKSGNEAGSTLHFFNKKKEWLNINGVIVANGTFATPSDCYYVRTNTRVSSLDTLLIEENTIATNYERYRESIKEIELPMIGGLKSLPNGVADFIDCYGIDKSITDVVQQVDKFILDGSKEWRIGIWNNENIISFELSDLNIANIKSDNTICEELECISMSDLPVEVEDIPECITGENGKIILVIKKSKLNTPDVIGLRSYLSANPISLYCELKNKIIHQIDNLEPLKTYDGSTHIYQENNIQGDKQVSVLTSFKKSLERLEEEKNLLKRDNSDLSNYVKLQSEYFYEQNLSLASSNLDLDFRVMELEFALDIPVIFKGDREMAARTPYEMMKILIIGGRYDREDLEYKMSVYIKRGRMTQEEADELVALMDARELENK